MDGGLAGLTWIWYGLTCSPGVVAPPAGVSPAELAAIFEAVLLPPSSMIYLRQNWKRKKRRRARRETREKTHVRGNDQKNTTPKTRQRIHCYGAVNNRLSLGIKDDMWLDGRQNCRCGEYKSSSKEPKTGQRSKVWTSCTRLGRPGPLVEWRC